MNTTYFNPEVGDCIRRIDPIERTVERHWFVVRSNETVLLACRIGADGRPFGVCNEMTISGWEIVADLQCLNLVACGRLRRQPQGDP